MLVFRIFERKKMGQRRRTEEEIIEILREAESDSITVAEVCRKHGMSDATYYKWKNRYGGTGKSEVRRMRELEKENTELKKALGEHVIALNAVKDQLKKRGWD
jgi:putative transposase